jgi:glutamate-1-semialdehyde 2,1-aminomutase
MVFENAYHGGFLTFGSKPGMSTIPHDWVIAKYNDVESTKALLSEDLAAIIVEPMQGAGGCIPATASFLQFLRDSATQVGAVLIFDEIITSRLGYHGLQGYHDIYPDITTAGKYLAGGIPFGTFGGRSDIMAVMEPFTGFVHSGTFNNNVFAMTAALTAAKILTKEKFEELNAIGDALRIGAEELFARKGFNQMYMTGMGSAVCFQFRGELATDLRDCFFFYLINHGVYCRKSGSCYMNIMHTKEQVDRVLKLVDEFVNLITQETQ